MKAINLILFLAALSLVLSMQNESTPLKLNQKVSGYSTQKSIQYYKLKIEENSKNQDLYIRSKTIDSQTIFESPITMISPVNKTNNLIF